MTGVSLLAMLALAVAGPVTVFPLSDQRDPLQVSHAVFNADDPEDPEVVVELENTTGRAISTNQIWLRASQFFTPSEMTEDTDRATAFCGRLGQAAFEDGVTDVGPGARVTVRFAIGTDCDFDSTHVHLYIHVASIGPGPIDQAVWFRDPASFAALLAAAMPHP